MVSEWNQIIGTIRAIGVWDIVDIVIVAILIYQVIKLIRETRAMQLAKGLILLLLLYFVAYNLNMKTVKFIMQNLVATGVLALVIVFQPVIHFPALAAQTPCSYDLIAPECLQHES